MLIVFVFFARTFVFISSGCAKLWRAFHLNHIRLKDKIPGRWINRFNHAKVQSSFSSNLWNKSKASRDAWCQITLLYIRCSFGPVRVTLLTITTPISLQPLCKHRYCFLLSTSSQTDCRCVMPYLQSCHVGHWLEYKNRCGLAFSRRQCRICMSNTTKPSPSTYCVACGHKHAFSFIPQVTFFFFLTLSNKS